MANKKVYINTIAQIAGKVSTALISIVLIKILTNYLDLEGYGLYAKIYNYLSIFSVIADLGLYTVSVREISANKDRPERVRHIAGNILALRTILGGVIIAVSLGLAAFLPGYDNRIALAGVGIAGVFTLFGLMNSSILSLLQAHLRTEFSFVSVTIGKITNLLAVLFTVFLLFPKPLDIGMLWGIERETLAFIAIMLSGLIGNIVMTGLLYGYSRKVEKIRFIFDPIYLKWLIISTLPYGFALFLNAIFFKVDIVLLSLLSPPESADTVVALYGVPMKIVEVGMMFGVVFLNSMLPLFTEAIANKEKLLSYVHRSYTLLLFFGFWAAVFLSVIPDTILSLIASQAYLIPLDGVSSADILRVVSMIFCLYFISSLFTYLLVARGDQSRLLRVNLIVATFNIVGNIIVIPTYSFMGSAWVTVVSQILLVILTAHATRHIVRFDFLPRVSLIILATGLLSGYLVLLARDPLALWLGGFGLAHYLFLTLEVLLLSSLFAFIYFLPIVLRKLLRPSPLS